MQSHKIQHIHQDPISTAHSLTGAHMQNTYTHTQIILYMHTGREANSFPVTHDCMPGSLPYILAA